MESALLVSLFILLPIVVFVALAVSRSRKRSEKQKNEMLRVYREIVVNDHLNIVDEEILVNKVFALDPMRKMFVYVYNYDGPVYDIVHLNGMSGCTIEKKGSKVATTSNGKSVMELHVSELYISFLSQNEVLTSFRVYSEMRDGQEQYLALAKTAEAWQQKLNKLIKASASIAG